MRGWGGKKERVSKELGVRTERGGARKGATGEAAHLCDRALKVAHPVSRSRSHKVTVELLPQVADVAGRALLLPVHVELHLAIGDRLQRRRDAERHQNAWHQQVQHERHGKWHQQAPLQPQPAAGTCTRRQHPPRV